MSLGAVARGAPRLGEDHRLVSRTPVRPPARDRRHRRSRRSGRSDRGARVRRPGSGRSGSGPDDSRGRHRLSGRTRDRRGHCFGLSDARRREVRPVVGSGLGRRRDRPAGLGLRAGHGIRRPGGHAFHPLDRRAARPGDRSGGFRHRRRSDRRGRLRGRGGPSALQHGHRALAGPRPAHAHRGRYDRPGDWCSGRREATRRQAGHVHPRPRHVHRRCFSALGSDRPLHRFGHRERHVGPRLGPRGDSCFLCLRRLDRGRHR